MPITVDDGSTHPNLGVSVEPLLSSSKRDGLDVGDGGIGAIPSREIAGWSVSMDRQPTVSKRGIGDNLKEVAAHLLEIRCEFTLDVDNENGCNHGLRKPPCTPRKIK